MKVFKIWPHLPDPLGGVKGQIFKFSNNSINCQYFLLKFRMQTVITINMKHIKSNFWSKACDSTSGWTQVEGSKDQNSTFSEHSHVAYQIKEITNAATW